MRLTKFASVFSLTIMPILALATEFPLVFAAIGIVEPKAGSVVPMMTEGQKAYLALTDADREEKCADPAFRTLVERGSTTADGQKRRHNMAPATLLKWTGANGESRVTVRDVRKDRVVFEVATTNDHVCIDNLETAAVYEWKVCDNESCSSSDFRTEDVPFRFVRFPGVPNVRDLGGKVGLDGRRVRQGLVYRSTGLNDNAGTEYYTLDELRAMNGDTNAIAKAVQERNSLNARLAQLEGWLKDTNTFDRTDKEFVGWRGRHPREGIEPFLTSRISRAKGALAKPQKTSVVKNRTPGHNRVEGANGEYIRSYFGIKTDIDLRSAGECWGMTGSPLGDSVKWMHYSFSAYGGVRFPNGKAAFKNVFTVFLDENNYPIDFHCIAGRDRTGTVAAILLALLGVDESVILADYCYSDGWTLWTSHGMQDLFNTFRKAYPEAKSFNAAIEEFVLSVGFTPDDIAKFRAIMLE